MQLPAIYNKSRSKIFVRLAMNGLAQAAMTVVTMGLVRRAFDGLISSPEGIRADIILQVGLGLGLVALCIGWLRMMERVDAEKLGQSYIHQIRMRLFRHMIRLDSRALQSRSRGAVVLRFIGDLNALKRWVSMGMARIIVAAILTVCALIALAVISSRLAIVLSLVFGLATLYAIRLGRYIREAVKESRRRRAYLAANVNEKVATMQVVQVFGQSNRERRRVNRQSRRLTDAMIDRAKKIGLMRGITQSVLALASGVVLLVGAYEVSNGNITPGTVVAAMTIIGFLSPALRDLSRVYEYYQESRVSKGKLLNFLETRSSVSEQPGAPDLKPDSGRLEYRDVSYGNVLKNISITAQAKEKIVVVGGNGAGKSTLLSLATRLIAPDKGTVLLDGQDIALHSLASVRRAISIVSPDLPLLRGTIKKNLLYRWPDAPENEIGKVWKACGISELLDELPLGERTRVTEEGRSLSLGQRQRIGLARAFLGNPKVVLLDEADAHLDKEASAILDRVLSMYQGTTIWVTHNAERLNNADCIWSIEKGKLTSLTSEHILRQSNG